MVVLQDRLIVVHQSQFGTCNKEESGGLGTMRGHYVSFPVHVRSTFLSSQIPFTYCQQGHPLHPSHRKGKRGIVKASAAREGSKRYSAPLGLGGFVVIPLSFSSRRSLVLGLIFLFLPAHPASFFFEQFRRSVHGSRGPFVASAWDHLSRTRRRPFMT